jgi:rubredoxin
MNYCPECGAKGLDKDFENRCKTCGFTFKIEYTYQGRPGPEVRESCGA